MPLLWSPLVGVTLRRSHFKARSRPDQHEAHRHAQTNLETTELQGQMEDVDLHVHYRN
jgi:hypothetical protein